MNLQLIALDGVKLDTPIYSATIPTTLGDIGVFPDHESLVTMAVPGVITIHYDKDNDSHTELFAISGGVVEISQERIRVLVDEADSSEDIVEEEAEAALQRALALRDEATDQIELEKAHQLVDRHSVRLKVAGLRRRKRQ